MSACMRATSGDDVCRRRTGSIVNVHFACWQHKGQPVAACNLGTWAPNWLEIQKAWNHRGLAGEASYR